MRTLTIFYVFFLICASAEAQQGSVNDSINVDVPDSAAIANVIKKSIEDSLSNQLPAIDTTDLRERVKASAKQAIEDSLGVKLPDTDTTKIKEKIKSASEKALNDSLNNYVDVSDLTIDSTTGEQIKNKAKARVEKEIGHKIPQDSARIKQEAKQLAKDQLKEQTGIDAPDITLDSTTVDQVKEEAATRAEQAVKNTDEFKALEGQDSELGELKAGKEKIEKTQQELKQQAARKELKKKMASQAKQYISEYAEQIQQVQSKMGELKKNYIYVPNSNDLSTARKRTSLKDESFWERLLIGGNFNVSSTNPLAIDLSPVLGWKFNSLFQVGVSGAYRAKLGADKRGINTFENEKVYGYSIFANHMVFKNFFGYLEGERISKVSGMEESHSRQWHQTLLLGIGRKFKIAKFLEMQAIVSYNFLHENNDGVYNSPVVFKTGFRVVK